MKSKVRVAGHGLHPMLIAFPLGLLGISPLWDILRLATDKVSWGNIGYWTIVAGVLSAVVAAIPGFVDWIAIPKNTRAKTIGVWHMVTNLVVLALFAISLWLRQSTPGGHEAAGLSAFLPAWLGVAMSLVSAWFGGELVERLGMSVDEGANLNAPSSLKAGGKGRPAPSPKVTTRPVSRA
ncbi:MAG TPA: DUF2231 domain-containing protein [Polyangia bacterium]